MIGGEPGVVRDVEALGAALEAMGVAASLEARDGLALLTPRGDGLAPLHSAETRGAVLALARRHGFTHVAVELSGGGGAPRSSDASVSRD